MKRNASTFEVIGVVENSAGSRADTLNAIGRPGDRDRHPVVPPNFGKRCHHVAPVVFNGSVRSISTEEFDGSHHGHAGHGGARKVPGVVHTAVSEQVHICRATG